ncbi:uncharacterized protein [Drosophila takahashii]|uniref:uncharacterized protein n=1 Tax=Drosophila takahashii TaxID=29030 RepID=UPI001CF912BE|nr:uncharacterized protein LOC108057411 [Drosophila takahashii]
MDRKFIRWIICFVLISLAKALEEEIDGGLLNITSNPSDDKTVPKLPSEVQKAVCTVTAGEVKASAEAVTTKTLKGVCGSEEMNMAFRSLENKLYEELRVMKLILVHLAKANGLKVNTGITTPLATPQPTAKPINIAPLPLFKPIDPAKTIADSSSFKAEENEVAPDFGAKKTPTLKNLETKGNSDLGPRDNEVDKFNNTVLADQDVELFTYYWKLENVTELIKAPQLATVSSPIFSFKGKSLQLKCTFHHMNRELLNLQLGYGIFNPSSKPGQSDNVVIEMGGIFQNTKWTEDVPLKHKISILDQSHRMTQDLSSQALNKLDMGFSIPNSVLLGSPYIKQNSLLIQILLYL